MSVQGAQPCDIDADQKLDCNAAHLAHASASSRCVGNICGLSGHGCGRLTDSFRPHHVRAGSPVMRMLAPAPRAVAAPRRSIGWRCRIVAPIPARPRYLLPVATGVISTFPGGIAGKDVAKQSDSTESANNREPYHGREPVLTHSDLRRRSVERADIWSTRKPLY